MESSPFMVRLARATQRFYEATLMQQVTARGFLDLYPFAALLRSRYAITSKPMPHEFDIGDAKAIFRRARAHRPVSRRLLALAQRTMWREAFERGREEADWDE